MINPYEFIGHHDVSLAVIQHLETKNNFKHIYAVGHNRVWKK